MCGPARSPWLARYKLEAARHFGFKPAPRQLHGAVEAILTPDGEPVAGAGNHAQRRPEVHGCRTEANTVRQKHAGSNVPRELLNTARVTSISSGG